MATSGQIPLRLTRNASSNIDKIVQKATITAMPINNDSDGNVIIARPTSGALSSAWLGPSSSVSVSSSSPSSTTLMSLVGTAAATPLSSLDGWEVPSPSSGIGGTRTEAVASKGAVCANVESGATRSSCSVNGDSQSLPTGEVVSASFPAQSRLPAQATDASHRRQAGPQFLVNTRRQNKRLGSNDFIDTGATGSPIISASALQTSPLPPTPKLPAAGVDETPARISCLLSQNLPHQAAVSSPTLVRATFSKSTPPPPQQPAIVRTTSSRGKLPLRQPTPDANVRSGIFAGNIAQLEASAERLSMTSSIDDAIREEHQQLKRSDSRRSSILSASVRQAAAQSVSDSNFPLADASPFQPRPAFSRRNSIIELNSALRTTGCFSPSDFIMSPASSVSGSGLRRSGSKSSSIDNGSSLTSAGDQPSASNGSFPFISRHGPGKTSVHSNRSGPLTLPEIAETEPPMALTQDALDDADRLIAAGRDHEEEDAICAKAHQHVISDVDDSGVLPNQEPSGWSAQPSNNFQPTDHNPTTCDEYLPYDLESGGPYGESHGEASRQERDNERPTSSASIGTFEQAEAAFGDFDGVHCDPDTINGHSMVDQLQADVPLPLQLPRQALPPPPTSYLDPGSGRQMLYYPARVPAMLSLPPKLSKKSKATERNNRRSKGSGMMAHTESQQGDEPHQPHAWLPDPVGGNFDSPLLDADELTSVGFMPIPPIIAQATPDVLRSSESLGESFPTPGTDAATDAVCNAGTGPPGSITMAGQSNLSRPSRKVDNERRKSRMSGLGSLPPQLRASAFFDLPASTADVQVKNGSAMDTLDSILDAAATAPVSAFTDHAFAGRLGAEVYGIGKKRNKRNNIAVPGASGNSGVGKDKNTSCADQQNNHVTSKTRGPFVSLIGHMRKVGEPVRQADDKQTINGPASRRRDILRDGGRDELSPGLEREGAASLLAPDEDEQSAEEDAGARGGGDGESEDEGESGDEVYEGAPTTLLAELQLRKQQQKLRTRPAYKTFPNGMHSTLLELDAVAEVEQKARKGKKVNLAWEDPSMNPADDDDDDDDVPLGLLYAAKTAGHSDISALMAEMNRPLGLMERKELEDNEPLSKRRDRLQGRNPGIGMYLAGGDNALKRLGTFPLTPTMAALNSSGSIAAADRRFGGAGPDGRSAEATDEVGEVEDEPLAARLRRIKAKEESELPRARPVSTAFSAELLSHFGDLEEEAKEGTGGKEKGKAKEWAQSQPTEEDETLGQRRRRLQAEKEAREAEMLHSGGASGTPACNDEALDALTGASRLTNRLSMANVLSAHPLEAARGLRDPREVERQKANSSAHAAHDKEQKMAAMRAQMPQSAPTANIGGGGAKASGFMRGHYGNGSGGLGMSSAVLQTASPALGTWATSGGMAGRTGNTVRLNSLVTVNHTGSMEVFPSNVGMRANTMNARYGYGHGHGAGQQQAMGMGMGMAAGSFSGAGFGAGFGANSYTGYAGRPSSMPMHMPVPPPGQVDRVERWRQSVMP